MTTCNFCGGNGKGCVCRSYPANDNNHDIIRLPSDERLGAPSSVQRLAIAWGATGISRRKLLDHFCDVIFNDDRIVIDAKGRRVIIDPEYVDRAFRTDNDPSIRYLSDFLAFRHRAPCRASQARTLPRLQVLWHALYIRWPSSAISVVR
jgi:hypothetical protein